MENIPFKTEVVMQHRGALERLVHEAITIRRGGESLLNLKEEYSRSTLPTLRIEGMRQSSKTNTEKTESEKENEKDTESEEYKLEEEEWRH